MTNEIDEPGLTTCELIDTFKTKYEAFAASSNARAIPHIFDGFKPVHRRILYGAMSSAPSNRQEVKSAKIVGEVLAG